MAVRAADKVTLAVLPSPSYVRQYYVLQGSALATPALPTTNPPGAPWTVTEPTYTAGSTNTLYTVMLTAYGSVAFEYGPVQESSSYAAAKQAYNLAAAASSAAAGAQTTADGKNKVIYSTANASGTTGYVAGDVWFKTTGNLIVAQWVFTTSWESRTLDSAVIANLDAGKISTGFLAAARIQAQTIDATKLAANSITAANAAIADLAVTNAKIANIDAAKITTGYLAAGRIDANTIAATHIAAGAVTAGKLATDSVTANNILAGSITVGKLAVGALDAYLITGANIQTDPAANRGLVLNSTGLKAYNSSGVATMTINSSTGAVSMAGLTATGANISGIVNATGGTFSGSINVTGDLTSGGTGYSVKLTSGTVAARNDYTNSVATLGAASLSFVPGSTAAYGVQMSLSLDNAQGTSGGVNGIWFGTRAGPVRITNTGGLLTLAGSGGVRIEHNGGESGGPRFSDYGETSITDANQMVKTGFYRGTTIQNSPTTNGWWFIDVQAHDGDWVSQNAYAYANEFEGQHWRRIRLNGAWREWKREDGVRMWNSSPGIVGNMPSGAQLLTQAGKFTASTNGSGDASFYYPSVFPNGVLSVQMTRYDTGVGDTNHILSTTQYRDACNFRVYQSGGATLNNYTLQYAYTAIGW